MERNAIIRYHKAQQKIILLCFIVVMANAASFAQIRFIKTLYGPENYVEYANKSVELKSCYVVPVQSLATVKGNHKFYILKLSKNGEIVSRTYFDNWDEERGPLFYADDTHFWKINRNYDSADNYINHFSFRLYGSDLNELVSTKVPRTFPSNGSLGLEQFAFLKLSNGDFIFMLDVSAYGWKPFGRDETYGSNFIYITRDGEIKANKAFNEFQLPQNIWQISDTSICMIVQLNGCTKDCSVVKVLDFNGNEILTKILTGGGFQKKYDNRYYGFREWKDREYAFTCFDENFELLYEKKIPKHIRPWQFWDSRDNDDFRVRVGYSIPDAMGYPTNESYETMMDTSFTWQKLKLWSNDTDDVFQGLYDNLTESGFYPTDDGGAFYIFNKTLIIDYDEDLVFVKVDTNWVEKPTPREEEENRIYPNPNNSSFMVIKKDGWQSATIYDLLGRDLFHYEYNSLNHSNGINIQNLQPGNYFLQIVFPDKTIINKFIRY